MDMVGNKYSFRQRWFPAFDDDEIMSEREGGMGQFYLRWARSAAVAACLAWVGYNLVGNQVETSVGNETGFINSISERGIIWSTKEGHFIPGKSSKSGYSYYIYRAFNFSIDRTAKRGEDVEGLYTKLNKCMESKQEVKISYIKQMATWPWVADSTCLIQKVECLETKTSD